MKKNLKAKFLDTTVYEIHNSDKRKNYKRAFHSLTGECIDNFIYLFGMDCNCICSIDKTSGKIDIQYGDDSEPIYKEFLYIASVSYKKNIYFIADRTNTILKFNPSTNQKKYLFFDDVVFDYITVLNGANLFLLPVGYTEKFVRIDLENSKISYPPVNYKSDLITSILREPYIFGTAVVVNQCCYRGSYVGPYLQKFYMDSGKFEYIKVNGFDHPIQNITFDGKYFWILSRNDGTLISWDEKTNNIVLLLDIAKETNKPQMTYVRCEYYNGILYILEERGSCIIEIDIKKDTFFCFDCTQIAGFELRRQNGQAFSEFIKTDGSGTIYFFPFQSNGIVSKDKTGNIYFYITENDKILNFAEGQQQNENINTLFHFSETIQKTYKKAEKNINCGQSILNNIMEII